MKQTTATLKVVPPDGTGANSPLNMDPVLLFEGDDDYEHLSKRGKETFDMLHGIHQRGVQLDDGEQVEIKLLLGGDLKFLVGEMGIAGCSCEKPCVWCLIELKNPAAAAPQPRTVEHAAKCSHSVIPGFLEAGYECPKMGCSSCAAQDGRINEHEEAPPPRPVNKKGKVIEGPR